MNHIELGAPACLPLAIIKTSTNGTERICLFGAALQHPPINVFAQHSKQFSVTGARANVAIPYVERYCNANGLLQPAEIEIELAIPAHMGLGSKPMLGMAMAKSVAWINGPPGPEQFRTTAQKAEMGQNFSGELYDQAEPRLDDPTFLTSGLGLRREEVLYRQAALKGGLLLVDPAEDVEEQTVLHRHETDTTEKNAWAFVLVLPRPPADTSESLEEDRLDALLNAAMHLDTESSRLFDEMIWPAIEQDDLAAFGAGLMQLQQLNQVALEAAGQAIPLTDWEQSVLTIMADNGAVAWGRSPTGYALFALARGARTTINIRAALRSVVPHDRANMIATIVDNDGMKLVEKPGKIKLLI